MDMPRALASALPDFATAFLFAATWFRPQWLGLHWIKDLVLVVLVEFLVVHSFGFLFVATQQAGWGGLLLVLGVGAIYLAFAAALAAAFKSWWPVWMLAWLVGSKLWALLAGGSEGEAQQGYAMGMWLASTLAYLIGCLATAVLPLPRLGVRRHGREYGIDGKGLWVEQPHRVLAFGLAYFGFVGVARLLLAMGAG